MDKIPDQHIVQTHLKFSHENNPWLDWNGLKWIEYAQSDIGNFDRLDYAQPRTIGSVPFSARCAWTSHRRVALASLQTLAWSKTCRNKLNPDNPAMQFRKRILWRQMRTIGWSCQAWTTLGNSVGAHSWGRRPYRWWPQTKWDSWVVTRLSLNRRSCITASSLEKLQLEWRSIIL